MGEPCIQGPLVSNARKFTGGASFRARCNFGIARRGLRWRELSQHNETKIYLKYFGVTRYGLKFLDKPNMYYTKSIRTSVDEKTKKKSIRSTQESLVPCIVPNQFTLRMSLKTLNSCYVQLKYFATCLMHATYYSNERFSAFQTYILPLQYELNLNSFLYLNKIYNDDCCEVKPFEFVSLF